MGNILPSDPRFAGLPVYRFTRRRFHEFRRDARGFSPGRNRMGRNSCDATRFSGWRIHKPNQANITDIVRRVRRPGEPRRGAGMRGRPRRRAGRRARAFPDGGAMSAVRPRSSPGRGSLRGENERQRRRTYSVRSEPKAVVLAIA
jgi:hypothetical protein